MGSGEAMAGESGAARVRPGPPQRKGGELLKQRAKSQLGKVPITVNCAVEA